MFEKNQGLLILLAAVMVFLGINFDPALANVYLGMLVVYYMIADDTGFLSLNLFRESGSGKWLRALAWGAGAYIVLSFATPFIINFVFPQAEAVSVQALTFSYLQAALTSSESVRIVAYGFLIPIIESLLFFVAFPQVYAKYLLKGSLSSMNVFSLGMVVVIIFASSSFAIFHYTAKGVSNEQALAASFIFAVASMVLFLWRKQGADMVILHIINNLHALLGGVA